MKTIWLLTLFLLMMHELLADHPLGSGPNPLVFAAASKDPKLSSVFSEIEKYQPQIIFSRIHRIDGSVYFQTHHFNVDPERYFYPASTIKLPMAILAVEKLNELKKEFPSLKMDTPYKLSGEGVETIYPDPAERSSTIARDIERIAVVSDNMAFNRLYDFVGPDALEQRLNTLGLSGVRAAHRLAISLSAVFNRTQLGFEFATEESLKIEGQFLGLRDFGEPITLGKGYISRGTLVEKPFPVHRRNQLTLETLHGSLFRLVVPEVFRDQGLRYELSHEQREFLLQMFSRLPSESPMYQDSPDDFPDNGAKFLIFGDAPERSIPPEWTIVNKIGQAYGFLSDSAYVRDEAAGVEFLLSAVVYVNANEIFNDGVYEYENIGLPFLGALGRSVYAFEKDLQR